MAATGCGGSSDAAPYDETAHRTALEQRLGHQVNDWPTVLELERESCAADANRFALDVALAADGGRLEAKRVNIAYVCPERSAELERVITVARPG